MGNTQGTLVQPADAVDFAAYAQQPWRSERSNELDRLGGVARPPSALGQSFDAKMRYLGEQLLEQGDKMQDLLSPQLQRKESKKQNSVVGPKNTYMRAVERQGGKDITPERPNSHRAAAASQPGVVAPPRFLTQAEYQKYRKAQAAAEKQRQQAKEKPPAKPAEWRKRVHNSRRKALLMVKTMLLLKRGHKHPKRMMRFADLGFYIPQLLGEDCSRFAAEQQRYSDIRRDIALARGELDELLRSSSTTLPAAAATATAAGAAAAEATAPPSGHRVLQPTLSDGALGTAPPRRTSVVDSDAAVAAGGALVKCLSDTERMRSADSDSSSSGRRVTFDGGRKTGATGSPPAHADRNSGGRDHALAPQRSFDTPAGAAAAAHAAAAASGWRPELVGLTDVIEEDTKSTPGVSTATSPVRLPAVHQTSTNNAGSTSQVKRTSAPRPDRDRLSGGGGGGGALATLVSPPRRPVWGSRAASMQQRAGGAAGGRRVSDNAGDVINAAGNLGGVAVNNHTPKRVNRVVSMPVARATQSELPPAGGSLTLPDIHGGRESAGGAGSGSAHTRVLQPRPSLPTQLQSASSLTATQSVPIPQEGDVNDTHNTHTGTGGGEEPSRPVSRYGRMAQLRVELDKQYDLLKRSSKLMGMYTNRVNGSWAEAQQWLSPIVTSASDLALWAKSEQFPVYRADVIRQLRLGQIAVQLLVGEDEFTIPARGKGSAGGAADGSGAGCGAARRQDLWSADLWELIEQSRPGIIPATARIGGLTLCGRALCQLSLTVQSLAGADALQRLHVVLHVNEEQEGDMLEELHTHQCYGLNRNNVFVVVSNRHPGYRWDPTEVQFQTESSLAASWAAGASLAATATGQHPDLCGLGSGAAVCQLAWAGEAFCVGEDGSPVPLDVPILERFESKKIDWLVSRRARDLGLLTQEGVIDMVQMAHAMQQRDRQRATCVLEAMYADSAVTARLYDSVLLHATGKAGSETRALIHELRQNELVAGPLISLVESLRTQTGGRGLALGMHRYLVHVPTLRGQLTSLSVFRPRLSLNRHLLNVSLDIADLWAHDKSRPLAVEARSTPGVLSTMASLESLVPLLQAQDHDPAFRDLVLKLVPPHIAKHQHMDGPSVIAGNKAMQQPGKPIIVFLANNPVAAAACHCAANIARAGRDTIQLVTIVSTDLQRSAAEELLGTHKRIAMRSMAEVTTHVIVRRSTGLLDCMETYVTDVATNCEDSNGTKPLVVMGSVQLTSSVFSYMTSSVTLSAIKRLAGVPVVVVTLNSKQVGTRQSMRYMTLVEPHSKSLLSHMCKHVVEHPRGDRLLLSQVAPSPHITRQQAAATRRLVENFHTLAFSCQTPIHKDVSGEGALESVVCEQVEEHGVGVVAVQLPPGVKSIPTHLINMMRSNRGATLVMHADTGVRQSVLRRSVKLQKSISMLTTLQQARKALQEGEALSTGGS